MDHHPKRDRICWDSTSPDEIPEHSLVAAYAGFGTFQWTQAQVDRQRGVIGVYTGHDPGGAEVARVCDVQPGAMDPSEVPGFIKRRISLGHHDAMPYVNLSNWDTVEELLIREAIPVHYWWVAHPGGTTDVRSARGTKPTMVQNFWGANTDKSVILLPVSFTPASHFKATG